MIKNIYKFIIHYVSLFIYKYPRAGIPFPTLSPKVLPSCPASPFPTIVFHIMGNLSLSQLPQMPQSTSFGNGDVLEQK